MKRFFLFTLFLMFIPCGASASSPQAERLSQELSELLPRDARWGVTVLDMKSGREIVSVGNTVEPLSPASLIKLFTAGAALEREAQGKPVVLTTKILHDGTLEDGTLNGTIYLRGRGNCLLSAKDLQNAAQELRHKGIRKVNGGVVADATRFDARGLERSREGAGHAPVAALGLDLHTVSLDIAPGEAGKPPRVSVEPPNPEMRFAVAARTMSGGKNSLAVRRGEDSGYLIGGDLPIDSTPQRWRFALTDPPLYAARSFRGILNDAGIQVVGDAGTGRTPNGVTLLVTISGPTLEQFIQEMNFNSLNVAADNLLLALGTTADGPPGTRETGTALLQQHLAHQGISNAEATVVDGSGLLPGNRVTTRAVARYLAFAASQPWFSALHGSLPRAGLDGILRSGTFTDERFRAKSGNLENVTALAGYGVDKSGREIVFAFIANSGGPMAPNSRGSGDMVMRFLAE